jgi:thiazole synthase ThiGH ThiG subunit
MFSTMFSLCTPLLIAGREFHSRLLVGTGKFSSPELMRDALEASGTQIVTVALRRADLSGQGDPFANILDFVDPKKYLLLPNTSGAMNAAEAVRLARLAQAAGLPNWIKLEIHPDPRYLLPDPVETLAAAESLVKEGFVVLPYINADPVLATIAGCRRRHGHASGFAYRLQSRPGHPRTNPHHHRAGDRACRGGRRHWRAQPCR